MKYPHLLFLIILFTCSCAKKSEEKPLDVAKQYCDCLTHNINAFKDSLINEEDCENEVYMKSRLMQIKFLYDKDPFGEVNIMYSKGTIDSAKRFFSEVIRIIDTMCFIKVDQKRLKKSPPAF